MSYWVYILTNRITRLVYAEEAGDAMSAIQREKQIKGWTRARKNELVESINPDWQEIVLGQ